MTSVSPFKQKNYWLAFFTVLCLLCVIIGLLQIRNALSMWEFNVVSDKIKALAGTATLLFASLIIAFFWSKSNSSNRVQTCLQGIIIFYVAYEISVYGFAKILKTQFQPPGYVMDTPIGDLNGFWLTWVYYGHSYVLAFILGATQVGGSTLLLFRKTRLAGVFILLPVMVNIILVNHFYDISPLAYFNSLHYTLILFFLLFLDYEKLKIIFSYPGTISFNAGTALLNAARIIVIGGAFVTIYFLKQGVPAKTKLNGSWNVTSLTKNNMLKIPADTKDSFFSKIYFEWRYGCLFRYNLYRFEDRDLSGQYKVDEKQHTVLISFFRENDKKDTAVFKYRFISDSIVNMSGSFMKDSIIMNLKRQR